MARRSPRKSKSKRSKRRSPRKSGGKRSKRRSQRKSGGKRSKRRSTKKSGGKRSKRRSTKKSGKRSKRHSTKKSGKRSKKRSQKKSGKKYKKRYSQPKYEQSYREEKREEQREEQGIPYYENKTEKDRIDEEINFKREKMAVWDIINMINDVAGIDPLYITIESSPADVKKAYKRAAIKTHPDKANQLDEIEVYRFQETFKLLKEKYDDYLARFAPAGYLRRRKRYSRRR